jgi:uncharacterized protein (TIGR02246 family)
MRTLLIGCAVGVLLLLLTACGSSSASSSEQALRREADFYEISLIEKWWHQATSNHDVDQMMSLFAPNATYVVGGKTYTGKEQIRQFWLKAPVFQPKNHWLSDSPVYKIRVTVNGDRGTLYFECHYVDPKTGKSMGVAAANQQVARINGRWLVTNHVGGSATLSP